MRPLIVMPALILASTMALAQQGAPPAQPPAQLATVLAGWERTFSNIRSLKAECERTTVDFTFQTKEVFKGSAKYLRSPGQGSRASLELYKQTPQGPSKTIFEKYVCTGTFLYEYAPAEQVIRIHDLPPPKPGQKAGQISDDNFLAFLFGMKAEDAMERYQLSIASSDQYYHHLDILPKLAKDKADFSKARLVLRRDNFMPAQVWFLQPNNNQVTWFFPQIQPNVDLSPTEFQEPRPPIGWKVVRVPADAKAKVRGSGF